MNSKHLLSALLSFVTLLPFPGLASQYTRAIELSNAGQHAAALPLWRQLAERGDPVAQFNLGLIYSQGLGVDISVGESNQWFMAAARQGLVDANNLLRSNSIEAASQEDYLRAQLMQNPRDWVMQQNPRHFTLQLASSKNEALIKKYIDENQLQGKAGYYKSRRKGEDWFALVYGAYPTANAATESIPTLPANLRKWSPWVRRIGSIHKIAVK